MYPVSIKGVLLVDGKAVLVRNDRNEWELPGGRMEIGETPGHARSIKSWSAHAQP